MPVQKLKDFLDSHHIKYDVINHARAISAQQVAESSHISGLKMAKTIIVKLDGKMVMMVLPASMKVNLDHLRDVTGVHNAEMASELEFKGQFPDCEVGAMPPFGNLFGMDVYVDEKLSKEHEIAFNSGSHSECIKLAYVEFEKVVHPKIVQ